jgi:CRISPR/Cas system-associated exonuclease Cas4 (RecB family)
MHNFKLILGPVTGEIYQSLHSMEDRNLDKPFLKIVAEDLLRQFGNNLSQVCVVFPNKRARLFFSLYLGEASGGKTVWAPAYRTISELFQELSGLTLSDRMQLIVELYSVYKRITGTADNFDDFYYYGEILLADYEEIDKSLVDAHDLFRNLADLKSMEGSFDYLSEKQASAIRQFWTSFNKGQVSSGQRDFLRFWELLYEIYRAFREQLSGKKLAYEGMICREVAGRIKNTNPIPFGSDRYVMVGFNALNASEEILFSHLKRQDKAIFYWDYDEQYTASPWHEAGRFLRDNIKRYPAPDHSHRFTGLSTIPKNISVLPVSSATAQAKIIPAVFRLMGLSAAGNLRNTALVLPDERLMMPVMYSLPAEIRDINLTMGYPLRESAAFAFIGLIIQLYRNSLDTDAGETAFSHRDVIDLLKHPFVYSVHKSVADDLMRQIRENNKEFIGMGELQRNSDLQVFFRPVKNADEAVTCLISVLEYGIRNLLENNAKGTGDVNPFQLECLYQAYTAVSRLSDILRASGLSFSSRLLFSLVHTMCAGMAVPFSGEPLAGLQVLGILETRLLDFENVIILSMNEGIMPRALPLSSFIPGNLRVGFGMTVPEYHDAVYSYYFYRLIQRAKNVYLVYDESADGLVTGERSRFIHQLACENLFKISEIRLETNITPGIAAPIIRQKTDQVLEKLNAILDGKAGKYLSPSSINEFINCPLKFYFHRITSLEETEEVSEDIDPLIFGNILHASMHEIYEPFRGKEVSRENLDSLIRRDDNLEDVLLKSFRAVLYSSGNLKGWEPEGMHLITKEIIKKYILQLLKTDRNHAPFHLVSLEETYKTALPLRRRSAGKTVQIGGKIDRVDQYGGGIRIIDYKTGTENMAFKNLESLFTALPTERNDAAFQVFLYSWLFRKKMQGARVVPCLFYVRSSYKQGFNGFLKDQSDRTEVQDFTRYESAFEDLLVSVLETLADPSVPFVQTTDEEFCARCAYRQICHR